MEAGIRHDWTDVAVELHGVVGATAGEGEDEGGEDGQAGEGRGHGDEP
jgi:hypothetical protein